MRIIATPSLSSVSDYYILYYVVHTTVHILASRYVFITAQLLHGVGAAALVTLGTTLMDESVSKASAPMYIGLFESTFILGPALG